MQDTELSLTFLFLTFENLHLDHKHMPLTFSLSSTPVSLGALEAQEGPSELRWGAGKRRREN